MEFFTVTIIGFISIILFSFVGIYAQKAGLTGNDATFAVSHSFGTGLMLTIRKLNTG